MSPETESTRGIGESRGGKFARKFKPPFQEPFCRGEDMGRNCLWKCREKASRNGATGTDVTSVGSRSKEREGTGKGGYRTLQTERK